jgi:hypothetical protein
MSLVHQIMIYNIENGYLTYKKLLFKAIVT